MVKLSLDKSSKVAELKWNFKDHQQFFIHFLLIERDRRNGLWPYLGFAKLVFHKVFTASLRK